MERRWNTPLAGKVAPYGRLTLRDLLTRHWWQNSSCWPNTAFVFVGFNSPLSACLHHSCRQREHCHVNSWVLVFTASSDTIWWISIITFLMLIVNLRCDFCSLYLLLWHFLDWRWDHFCTRETQETQKTALSASTKNSSRSNVSSPTSLKSTLAVICTLIKSIMLLSVRSISVTVSYGKFLNIRFRAA